MSIADVMGRMRAFPKCKNYKKLSRQEKMRNAWHRAVGKLGEEKIAETVEAFLRAEENETKSAVDEIVLGLLAAGLSQIEVVAIIPVGGSRVSKLAKNGAEAAVEKKERIPSHAASDEDRQAILNQIETWDIEPGFPCEHGLEFLVEETEWQQLHAEYKKERSRSGKRVLGIVRWREYVRAFRPRLMLKNAKFGVCSCRYDVEMEILNPATPVQRKAELQLLLNMHDEALRERRAMNKFAAHYHEPQQTLNGLAVEETNFLGVSSNPERLDVVPNLERTLEPQDIAPTIAPECPNQPVMPGETQLGEKEDEFQIICIKEEFSEEDAIEGGLSTSGPDECWIADSSTQDTRNPHELTEYSGASNILRQSSDDQSYSGFTGRNVSDVVPESLPLSNPLESLRNVGNDQASKGLIGVFNRTETACVLKSSRILEGKRTSGIQEDVVGACGRLEPGHFSNSPRIAEDIRINLQEDIVGVHDGLGLGVLSKRTGEDERTDSGDDVVRVYERQERGLASKSSKIAEGKRTGIQEDAVGVYDRSEAENFLKIPKIANGKRKSFRENSGRVCDRPVLGNVFRSSRISKVKRTGIQKGVGDVADRTEPEHASKYNGITYKCSVCEKAYSKPRHLEIHMRMHTGVQLYKCFCCGERFSDKSKLRKHELRHAGGGPYHCAYCSRAFRTIRALKRHTIKHTGGKPFQCLICDDAFPTMACLQRHVAKHKAAPTYRCSDCDKTFSYQNCYKRHMQKHCGKTPPPEKKSHPEQKPHQCCICNKSFAIVHNLRRHIKSHTRQKPFQCSYCDKSFTANNSLVLHLRRHTGEKPHQCSVCGRRFTVKRTLEQHMRIHTGEKPYSCQICNKTFRNRSGRWSHMKQHSVNSNLQAQLQLSRGNLNEK